MELELRYDRRDTAQPAITTATLTPQQLLRLELLFSGAESAEPARHNVCAVFGLIRCSCREEGLRSPNLPFTLVYLRPRRATRIAVHLKGQGPRQQLIAALGGFTVMQARGRRTDSCLCLQCGTQRAQRLLTAQPPCQGRPQQEEG